MMAIENFSQKWHISVQKITKRNQKYASVIQNPHNNAF